jgi:CRP/FNR family transcriptional regulator, cyclic AMP receptor protein
MARSRRANQAQVERLRAVPLFSGCSDRELVSLGRFLKEVEYPAGREILKEGHTGVGLHVIMEGDTRVVVGGRTRRRLGRNAFFGEISLLDRGPCTATVIADTPVRTVSLSSWNFRAALKEHPSLTVKMLEELARRIRASGSSISD